MIPSGAQTSQQLQEVNGSAKYQINFHRLVELKRSATFMLASRLDADTTANYGEKQGKMDLKKMMKEIADRYGDDEKEFIQAELPIQEIVFRLLLVRGNEPISLQELQKDLNDRWSTPVRPINITLTGLKRIMDADTYYGFAPAE